MTVRKRKYGGMSAPEARRLSQHIQKYFANWSDDSGRPLSWIRSHTLTRCGDVYSPVRRPCSRSSRSAMADVEPLPLEPAT